MNRLKTLCGLITACAVSVFSVQAQVAVSDACAPVNQDAPAAVVKAQSSVGQAQAGTSLQWAPVANYQASGTASVSKDVNKARKKVASVSELEGQYVLTGTSLLTAGYNGVSVTVTAVGTDSIAIADFWASDYSTVVKAKVDVAAGTITIPYQVMGQHGTYGDIVFAKTDLSSGQPVDGGEVSGVITANGITLSDAWGAYVKASATATTWSYFSIVANSTLDKCNATFTGKKHSDGSLETYGLVVTQTGDNVLQVKNLGNYGPVSYTHLTLPTKA